MTHAAKLSVAIIGAGIGGLATALAMAQRGAWVTVYEQSDEIRAFGAGIQLGPNGDRALRHLGVDLTDCSVLAHAVLPMDALSGRQITRFDLTQYEDAAYRFVARGALIDALHGACRAAGVQIVTGTRVEFDGDAVMARGQRLTDDLIVGAGGLHSPMRAAINGAADPFFTGQVAWRAVIRADSPPVARVWMGPGRHLVSYPLGPGLTNLVAVQERQNWAAEDWAHPDDPSNLRHVFSRMAPGVNTLLNQVEDVHLWGLFRHEIAPLWHRGNMVLMGDAAHPTLPFMAQGANMALEDAVILARSIDALGVDQALPRYQALRQPRVTRAIKAANSNARSFHLSGPAKTVAHRALSVIGRVAPQAYLNRLSWLYDFDAGTAAL